MARGHQPDAVHARLVVAHAVLNLLGWVGLTVVGTLVTLWPTMLRTRVADRAEQAGRRGLPVLVAGVLLAAGASLAGVLLATAAGLLVVVLGVLVVAAPHVEEVRRKAPVELPTASVLAGLVWFVGSVVALAGALATSPAWGTAGDRAEWLTAPLLGGFAAQVLLGALSYLVPVVLGGGPSVLRATSAVLGRAAWARLVAANAGLLLSVLPVPSLVRVTVSLVVLAALASFLPLVVRAVVVARRLKGLPPAPAGPAPRQTAQRRTGRAAAGHTTTVDVRVDGMRFVPDVIDVPAGDRLVVVLHNTGDDAHDLVLSSGARTPRIAPGEEATLDAGVVGDDLDGWCSVAGHRQMGMVLTVRVVDRGGGAP